MDSQNASAVAIDQLVKRYKGVAAVDGITFRLAPGSVTGLLGGNGAGKTTTIAMIMGLVTPTSGKVTVLGADMPRQRYRVLHRMNFESPYVDMPMRLTVRQNLSVFAQLYAVPDIYQRIERLAADLGLTEFLDRPTGKLSAGQKTRVSLAKALLNKPEVLLLDEPTASLDPRHGRLGAFAPRTLSRREGRDASAGVAQHGRGRAPVRARHYHEARSDRGR